MAVGVVVVLEVVNIQHDQRAGLLRLLGIVELGFQKIVEMLAVGQPRQSIRMSLTLRDIHGLVQGLFLAVRLQQGFHFEAQVENGIRLGQKIRHAPLHSNGALRIILVEHAQGEDGAHVAATLDQGGDDPVVGPALRGNIGIDNDQIRLEILIVVQKIKRVGRGVQHGVGTQIFDHPLDNQVIHLLFVRDEDSVGALNALFLGARKMYFHPAVFAVSKELQRPLNLRDYLSGQGQTNHQAEPALGAAAPGLDIGKAGSLVGQAHPNLLRAFQTLGFQQHATVRRGHHQGLFHQQIDHQPHLIGISHQRQGLAGYVQFKGHIFAVRHGLNVFLNSCKHGIEINQLHGGGLEILLYFDQLVDVVRYDLDVSALLPNGFQIGGKFRIHLLGGVLAQLLRVREYFPDRSGQFIRNHVQCIRLQLVAALQFLVGRFEVDQRLLNFVVFDRNGPFLLLL